jgi:acyl-CoA synthetase (NDP forming)/RimJ/RimL family protein N-acetyltransferase
MSVRWLDQLFNPESIAVLGATNAPRKVGHAIMRNLLAAGFEGPILPVNPNRPSVCGVLAYPDVEHLPITPSLAIIATPADTVPGLLEKLADRGTRAAVVITDDMHLRTDANGRNWQDVMTQTARRRCIRVLGPSSLGVVVPERLLNASLVSESFARGRLAFVSQSRAMCAAVLDWARSRGIGFSHVVSVGRGSDVDVSDVLDHLATLTEVSAILVYVDGIEDARKFLSAGRAAARSKQVLVIRGPGSLETPPGTLVSEDAIYDAAFRRAGMLRVREIDELFDAVETLARAARPVRRDHLAVISTGTAPGNMAFDTLLKEGGQPALLSSETLRKLQEIVPERVQQGRPVALTQAAASDRYGDAIRIMVADDDVDAVLILHAPVGLADATDTARVVIEAARKAPCNVLTCWLGASSATAARDLFSRAGIPTYDTPRNAVRAFMHLVNFHRNQEMLLETPSSVPGGFTPAVEDARNLLAAALEAGRTVLLPAEVATLLAAYGVTQHAARDPGAATVLVGVEQHGVFGPVIVCGEGGAHGDRSAALPPLNTSLARRLVARTRSHLATPSQQDALCGLLLKVSQMVVDLPQLGTLELRLVLDGGAEARVAAAVAGARAPGGRHLAIRPYPKELEEPPTLHRGRWIRLRPIRPEDAPAHVAFFARATPEDRRLRFFDQTRDLTETEMGRFTQIDYDREMAFIIQAAQPPDSPPVDTPPETLGVVRCVYDADGVRGEFAVHVRTDLKGAGLGDLLMRRILSYSARRGARTIVADVLTENRAMLGLAQKLGFTARRTEDTRVVQVTLELAVTPPSSP